MKIMISELVAKTKINKIHICPRWNMFTAARNRLASSVDSSPAVLKRLAGRVNTSVQQRVAENNRTDSETLELLAQHESSAVRSAVAQNENSLRSTVASLASDTSCDVRFAIAEDPRTSTALLGKLAEDENPYVQNRARRTQAVLKAENTLLADQGRS